MMLCGVAALIFITARVFTPASTLAAEDLRLKGPGPLVLELFTSQSCSSCPPADALLKAAGETPNVIALGFHVTYWDHLGWKDTLSQDFSTQRQREYAAEKGSGRVYTPQMIVNGGAEFVGSDGSSLKQAAADAPPIARVGLKVRGHALIAELPRLPRGRYTLWLFATKDSLTQKIESGENGGRSVTYSHVVMMQQNLGFWDGNPGAQTYEINAPLGADQLVILAQQNEFGPIQGAGSLKLR